jgi:hypothetical protein
VIVPHTLEQSSVLSGLSGYALRFRFATLLANPTYAFRASELYTDYRIRGNRRTRRDIGVAMGRSVIRLVEEVFDIDLQLDVFIANAGRDIHPMPLS